MLYHDTFIKEEPVDLATIDFSQLSFEDRYWLLATKCVQYHKEGNRFLCAICITRLKELSFLCYCAERIESCGFLDDKYKAYGKKFEFIPSNERLIGIDRDINGVNKRARKLQNISLAIFAFAIGLIFLVHFAFNLDFIPSMAIGVGVSVIGNSIVMPLIAKKGKAKNPEVLKGEAPKELVNLINYDEVLNDLMKEKDYLPILQARNEQELNEAIRNFPKK